MKNFKYLAISVLQATYLACHIQIIQGLSLRPTIAKEVNEYHGEEKTRKNGLLQNE